jgi:hypothetical protein
VQILDKYNEKGECELQDDLTEKQALERIVREDVIGTDEVEQSKGDNLVRSLIRHDYQKLAEVLYSQFKYPYPNP